MPDVGTDHPDRQHLNRVELIGRVSAEPQFRTMPSGDRAVLWRVVVRRSAVAGARSGAAHPGATIDTIECVAWAAAVQRRVEKWHIGDTVECEGALRRRFWRTEQGTTSRYEVEVHRAHRIRAAKA